MIDITTDCHLKTLFQRAYRIIDSVESLGAQKMKWILGGETALALYFQHRKSHNLDIVIFDAQYLVFLTPRKNPITAKETDDYEEHSNYVKLRFGEYEINFIVAHTLTDLPPRKMCLFGRDIKLDSPAEILAKKIFYGASSINGRDLFDIVFAIQAKPELSILLSEFICLKKSLLEARLSLNHEALEAQYNTFREKYGGPDYQQARNELQKLM